MQPILQEHLTFLLTQNQELLTQLSDLRKTNSEYLDKIIELSEKNQRLSTELHDLKLSLLESRASTTPKKPRTRKPSSKKSTSSPTPPPHVLKQMEEAIALLNQQNGTNTSLADFDILPIEVDDSKI